MRKIKKNGEKTLFVAIILSIFLLGQSNVLAHLNSAETESFYEIFRMENDTAKFYITTMDTNETWNIELNASYQGIFYIFLFEERPLTDFTLNNGTLDPQIYETAVAYNNTPSDVFDSDLNASISNVELNYTYKGEQAILFYLQIIIVESGPDSFKLWSSKEIQPYYVPFISGYSTISTIGVTILTLFSIVFAMSRKRHLKFTS